MILLPVLGAVWVMVGGLITWYYPGLMWNTLSASGEEVSKSLELFCLKLPCLASRKTCLDSEYLLKE